MDMRENKVHKHVKQKETEGEMSDELLGLVQRKPCDLLAVVWTDGGDGQTVGRMILNPASDSEGGTGELWEELRSREQSEFCGLYSIDTDEVKP